MTTTVPHARRLLGAVAVTVLAAALLAGGLALAALAVRSGLATGRGPNALDELVGGTAAAVASALLAWWGTALLALVVAGAHPRGPEGEPSAKRRWAAARLAGTLPRPLRAVASLALGALVVGGATVPATAHAPSASVPAPTVATWAASAQPSAMDTLDPGWGTAGPLSRPAASPPVTGVEQSPEPRPQTQVTPPSTAGPSTRDAEPIDTSTTPRQWSPSRPPAPRAPSVALVVQQPRPSTAVTGDVVVRRGDTLWDLCARHLPVDATDAEIAREWPRWHAANRAVIGPDPDVLKPGQRLSPPAPTTAGSG